MELERLMALAARIKVAAVLLAACSIAVVLGGAGGSGNQASRCASRASRHGRCRGCWWCCCMLGLAVCMVRDIGVRFPSVTENPGGNRQWLREVR